MTREEEIRQAATEYADDYGCFNCDLGDVHTAFIDGAEWADLHQQSHWHSIADGDLPQKKVITSVLMERNLLLPTTLMQVDIFLIHLKDMEETIVIGLNIGWKYRNYRTLEKS